MSGPPWQNHFGEEALTTRWLQTSQSDGADWRAASDMTFTGRDHFCHTLSRCGVARGLNLFQITATVGARAYRSRRSSGITPPRSESPGRERARQPAGTRTQEVLVSKLRAVRRSRLGAGRIHAGFACRGLTLCQLISLPLLLADFEEIAHEHPRLGFFLFLRR